jgi:esterase/lipase
MERVAALPQTAKLFIQGRDNPAQAEATLQLFLRASEPRKQSVMSKSNYTQMQDEERKAYETEVVHFFLEAIPPALIR